MPLPFDGLALFDDKDLSKIPMLQRKGVPKLLKIYKEIADNRDLAILNAYTSGGYSMKEIGEYFGLHYSRVRT